MSITHAAPAQDNTQVCKYHQSQDSTASYCSAEVLLLTTFSIRRGRQRQLVSDRHRPTLGLTGILGRSGAR